MGIEIERKFLLKNNDWRVEEKTKIIIRQGYLNSNMERTVRIRTKADRGFITIKGKSNNATRLEFEYEIPVSEAIELLALCEKPIIEKVRFEIQKDGKTWEIDEFLGDNQGLLVAEIELDTEDESVVLPKWVGEEVTKDSRYFNSSLISHPYKNW